jgi:hypothetical protein
MLWMLQTMYRNNVVLHVGFRDLVLRSAVASRHPCSNNIDDLVDIGELIVLPVSQIQECILAKLLAAL